MCVYREIKTNPKIFKYWQNLYTFCKIIPLFFSYLHLNNEDLVIFMLSLHSLRGFAHINSDSVSLPALSTCSDGNLGAVAAA